MQITVRQQNKTRPEYNTYEPHEESVYVEALGQVGSEQTSVNGMIRATKFNLQAFTKIEDWAPNSAQKIYKEQMVRN